MSIDSEILRRLTNNDKTLTELKFDSDKKDEVLGNRWGVFSATPIERLSKALQGNQTVVHLTLANQNLSNADVTVIAACLKINRTITSLILSGHKLDLAVSKALTEALRVNEVLTALDLSSSKMSIEGFKALANMMKENKSLMYLNLSSCSNYYYEGEEMATALAEMLKVNSTLTSLEVRCNEMRRGGHAFAEALFVNRGLRMLDLDNNSFSRDTSEAFAAALKVNNVLTSLTLSHSTFYLEGQEALGEMLKVNSTLTLLNLSSSKLVNPDPHGKYSQQIEPRYLRGVIALAEALENNTTLRSLNLSSNEIYGHYNNYSLAEMLKRNHRLLKLDLSSNSLRENGIKQIAEGLAENDTLVEVDLSRNDLGPEGGKSVAEMLRTNHALTWLNLSHNMLGVEGGKALAEALRVNKVLKYLDITNNHMELAGSIAVAEMLKDNQMLTRLYIDHNGCDGHCHYTLVDQLMKSLEANETATYLDKVNNIHPSKETTLEKNILAKLNQNAARAKKNAQEAKEKASKTASTIAASVKQKSSSSAAPSQAEPSSPSVSKAQIDPKQTERSSPVATTVQKEPNLSLAQLVPFTQMPRVDLVYPSTRNEIDLQKKESASLDATSVQKLQKLSDKSSEILEAVGKLQAVDAVALQALQGRAMHLTRLFDSDAKAEYVNAERKRIDADRNLAIYHHYFVRLLTGTWLACQTINSGLVENAEKYTSDRVGQGLDAIGKHIPGISGVTSIFSGVISAWNSRERRQGVQKIASLFPDLETAFKELSTLARQATLAQETALTQLSEQALGFIARVKERAQDLKAMILADDVDTPIKRKAVADCQTVLTAVRDGRPRPNPSVADLLTVLMGSSYVYMPPTTPITSATPTPTPMPPQSPQSPSSPSMTMEEMMALVQQQVAEIKRLRERDEARERELHVVKQRLAAQQHNDIVVSGSSELQAQTKASSALNRSDVADQSLPFSGAVARLEDQVTRLTHQVIVVEARQQETNNTLSMTVARVDQQMKTSKR